MTALEAPPLGEKTSDRAGILAVKSGKSNVTLRDAWRLTYTRALVMSNIELFFFQSYTVPRSS